MFADIRTASFREVEFHIADTDVSGGRRVVKHEFPQRDIPYTEDLGRKAKSFNVTGFVTGKNYQFQRDKLIEALDKEGAGILIHPIHGEIKVQCETYSYKDSWSDHGKSSFTMTFAETQDTDLVLVTEPPETVIDKLCAELESLCGDIFGANFLTNLSTLYDSALAVVGAVVGAISTVMSIATSVLDFADDITRSVLDAQAGYAGLMQTPDKLARRITAPSKRLQEANRLNRKSNSQTSSLRFGETNNRFASQTSVRIFNALIKLNADLEEQTRSNNLRNTARQIQDAKNKNAVRLLTSTYNTTTAINTALEMKFDTYASASIVRNKLFTMLDDLVLQSENFDNTDEYYQKIKDLKIKIALAIPPQGATLNDIQQISAEVDTCGLVAVFEKYGFLGDIENDFIDRNGIRHPGLISAGSELEVIS